MRFVDRVEAGQRLAGVLALRHWNDPIVLALPRGGVPVGAQVAERLGAPMDVFVARKIGAPHHPEYGIGAIAEGGGVVIDRVAVEAVGVSCDDFRRLAQSERVELERRVQHYRGGRPLPDVRGHDVILVDDGLATGVTAEAALRALGTSHAARVVLAAPACAPDTAGRLRAVADDVVCVLEPEPFVAVGAHYERFDQTSDEEVLALLADHRAPATDGRCRA
jgi:putative phosphoribosyl transferase